MLYYEAFFTPPGAGLSAIFDRPWRPCRREVDVTGTDAYEEKGLVLLEFDIVF